MRHDATALPSAITKHAPHWPLPQPNLVPVSPRSSRRTLRSDALGGGSTSWVEPFTVRVRRMPSSVPTVSRSCSFSYFPTMRPLEDPKSIVRHGYDLVSRAYRADDAEDGMYADWLDTLETRVAPGSRILDLGCGCGVPVARRLAPTYTVTGIDLSPVQIARGRALVPRATFVCADMTTLRFPDESFSAITCFYALIHLPLAEQPILLGDIRRWLQPGGLFLATVGHGAWTGLEQGGGAG